jgi:hypothetical protein
VGQTGLAIVDAILEGEHGFMCSPSWARIASTSVKKLSLSYWSATTGSSLGGHQLPFRITYALLDGRDFIELTDIKLNLLARSAENI